MICDNFTMECINNSEPQIVSSLTMAQILFMLKQNKQNAYFFLMFIAPCIIVIAEK